MGKRFQDSNIIVKIWRYRWYLKIPFSFIYNFRQEEFTNKQFWSILIGEAQINMGWTYTMSEVKERLQKKYKI